MALNDRYEIASKRMKSCSLRRKSMEPILYRVIGCEYGTHWAVGLRLSSLPSRNLKKL